MTSGGNVSRKPGSQKGAILIQAGSWCVRWREPITDENGTQYKQRFKVIREVTDADKRNRNRKKPGKLVPPADVEEAVDAIVRPMNKLIKAGKAGQTIEYLVEYQHFPDVETEKKPSTMKGYRDLWRLHLKGRIGEVLVRDFRREDAFRLWRDIARDNKGMTGTTMQHIRTFLSGVFRWAKDTGLYDGENPAAASLPQGLPAGEPTEAYSLPEIIRILQLLTSPQTQALVALAFGAGLRKGELAALPWENYHPTEAGATIRITQAAWNGKILTPKTKKSADTVKIDMVFHEYVEAYRAFCGGVNSGLMFPGATPKSEHGKDERQGRRPLNLESVARWQFRTVLDRCEVCKRHPAIHKGQDHKFQRDTSLPAWKGWHAFRRGNATLLASEKDRAAAALMLRHHGTEITDKHYILNSSQDKRVADEQERNVIDQRKTEAAEALGAAFRRGIN